MTNESKHGTVFLVKLDYLRGKLLWKIYGLITPNNKLSVVLFAPIVDQPCGSGYLLGPP